MKNWAEGGVVGVGGREFGGDDLGEAWELTEPPEQGPVSAPTT